MAMTREEFKKHIELCMTNVNSQLAVANRIEEEAAKVRPHDPILSDLLLANARTFREFYQYLTNKVGKNNG